MDLFQDKNIFENILSGCCTVLAFVLIFLEFRTFISKPTSIEQTTTGLNIRLAPQAIFCLQPAFDMETLHALGFSGNDKNIEKLVRKVKRQKLKITFCLGSWILKI